MLDNSESVQVMVEDVACSPHFAVEGALSSMPKRRMADVMNQRQGFSEIAVESERRGYGTRDLRNFDGVGQAIAKMIRPAMGKNLSLVLQAAKGAGVDDAITIALKVRPVWVC